MKRFVRAAPVLSILLSLSGPLAADDRLWFGGGLGLSFGDVDYVEVSPLVGYSATDKLSVGGGLTYRYRNDDRYDLSTSDYGASAFMRYRFRPTLFGQAEVEYLSYEYVGFNLSKDRDTYTSVFGGPGLIVPMGSRSSFFALALYNFSYDDDEISPYDDDWVYRVGVTVGF